MLTIAFTVFATLLVVTLVANLKTPGKEPNHKVEHLFAVKDLQLMREMGILLGPAILPGNRILALQNGDEIFPAMLDAIRNAPAPQLLSKPSSIGRGASEMNSQQR